MGELRTAGDKAMPRMKKGGKFRVCSGRKVVGRLCYQRRTCAKMVSMKGHSMAFDSLEQRKKKPVAKRKAVGAELSVKMKSQKNCRQV